MKQFFKPEDFYAAIQYSIGAEECKKKICIIANAKLQNLIEASPKAYGNSTQFDIVSKPTSADTHSAVIMFIEEIPKKDCEHKRIDSIRFTDVGRCFDCGIELVATWKAVK